MSFTCVMARLLTPTTSQQIHWEESTTPNFKKRGGPLTQPLTCRLKATLPLAWAKSYARLRPGGRAGAGGLPLDFAPTWSTGLPGSAKNSLFTGLAPRRTAAAVYCFDRGTGQFAER